MGFDPDRNFQSLLREGIYAAQVGNRTLAWSLLTQAAQINPLDPSPWLWLTETTDDPAEKRNYLENALAADPRSLAARRGLARINGDTGPQVPPFFPDSIKQVMDSENPVVAKPAETFLCSKCGANLTFDLQANALVCHHCGYFQEVAEHSAADLEQTMYRVLPTEKGHRWAESQHHLVCNQCGANSLWPPGQAAVGCPYCGSHHLIESDETLKLLNPQAIAIMQISETEAAGRIVTWLGERLDDPR